MIPYKCARPGLEPVLLFALCFISVSVFALFSSGFIAFGGIRVRGAMRGGGHGSPPPTPGWRAGSGRGERVGWGPLPALPGGCPEGRKGGGQRGSRSPPGRPSKTSPPNSVLLVLASCHTCPRQSRVGLAGFSSGGPNWGHPGALPPCPEAGGRERCCHTWWSSRGRWAHLAPFKAAPCGVVELTPFPYAPSLTLQTPQRQDGGSQLGIHRDGEGRRSPCRLAWDRGGGGGE